MSTEFEQLEYLLRDCTSRDVANQVKALFRRLEETVEQQLEVSTEEMKMVGSITVESALLLGDSVDLPERIDGTEEQRLDLQDLIDIKGDSVGVLTRGSYTVEVMMKDPDTVLAVVLWNRTVALAEEDEGSPH